MTPARRRIEAALEVARRPTTIPAERDAAIAAAERIIESNGLDPASFDIPGRTRARDDRAYLVDFLGNRTPLEDVLRSFEDTLRQYRTATVDPFQAATRAEQARRKPGGDFTARGFRADQAVSFLWSRGVRTYQAPERADGSRRWRIENDPLEYTDEGIDEVAKRRGWRP